MTTELNWLSSWDTASFAEHLHMRVWDLTWFAKTVGGGRVRHLLRQEIGGHETLVPWPTVSTTVHTAMTGIISGCVGPEEAKAMRQELADELG